MAKWTPHYDLNLVKATVKARGISCFTVSALDGLAALDLTPTEALHVVATLQPTDFFRSMPTNADANIWQDVYRPYTANGQAYLKVMLSQPNGFAGMKVVMSFKTK